MRFFVEKFKWLMLVSGLLTCTMFLGLLSPAASLQSNFGETLHGPVAEIIVRNWNVAYLALSRRPNAASTG